MQIRILPPADLDLRVKAPERTIATGARAGTSKARRQVVNLFRARTKAGGLGRLAMAWGAKAFPAKGRALGPSVFVYARGGEATLKALEAHGKGAVIRARHSKYLAVPTKLAGKYVMTGLGRERITPRLFEFKTGIKLQFLPSRGNRPPLLIARDVRVSGRTRVRAPKGGSRTKTGRLKSGIGTAVIFTLVPLVRLDRAYDLKRLTREAGALIRTSIIKGIDAAAREETGQ